MDAEEMETLLELAMAAVGDASSEIEAWRNRDEKHGRNPEYWSNVGTGGQLLTFLDKVNTRLHKGWTKARHAANIARYQEIK